MNQRRSEVQIFVASFNKRPFLNEGCSVKSDMKNKLCETENEAKGKQLAQLVQGSLHIQTLFSFLYFYFSASNYNNYEKNVKTRLCVPFHGYIPSQLIPVV